MGHSQLPLGSPCQCLTTFTLKNFLPISHLNVVSIWNHSPFSSHYTFLQEAPLPLIFNKLTVSTERVQRGLPEACMEHVMDLRNNGCRRIAAFNQAVNCWENQYAKRITLLMRADENKCFLCLLLAELRDAKTGIQVILLAAVLSSENFM